MPNDNKLYLCFEYCEFDLKKYMKSQQYKVGAKSAFCMHFINSPRVSSAPRLASYPRRRLTRLRISSVCLPSWCSCPECIKSFTWQMLVSHSLPSTASSTATSR